MIIINHNICVNILTVSRPICGYLITCLNINLLVMHLKACAVKCEYQQWVMFIGLYLYCESLKTLKEASSCMIISSILCMTHLLLSTFWFRTEAKSEQHKVCARAAAVNTGKQPLLSLCRCTASCLDRCTPLSAVQVQYHFTLEMRHNILFFGSGVTTQKGKKYNGQTRSYPSSHRNKTECFQTEKS
jgi:hypothetical protein